MRTAAGVLLCIMAAINIVAGLGWSVGGGLMVGGGEFAEQAAEQARQEGGEEAAVQSGEQAGAMFTAFGGAILVYAIWLLVLAGLEIAAAVLLFKSQMAVFVIVVAALEGATDIGYLFLVDGFLFSVIGLVVTAFALVGGIMLRKEQQAAAA